MTNAIATTKAMLVSLNISVWTARKFDRKVTQDTNEGAHAHAAAGRYNKHLLAGAEAHKRIEKIAAKARVAHYAQTLPWSDEGWRLLPTANYMAYQDKMREFKQEFDAALAEFLREYPVICRDAAALLGDMYNPDDYPDVDQIRGKFRWGIEVSPVPTGNDLRVEIGEDQVDKLRASIEDRVQRATKAAVTDAWERLHGVVSKMHERLSDPDKIFRNSLIGNVQELVDLLTRLNVTGDENLEAFRKRVESELADLEPDELRKDTDYRADVAKQANDIMTAMADFYSN